MDAHLNGTIAKDMTIDQFASQGDWFLHLVQTRTMTTMIVDGDGRMEVAVLVVTVTHATNKHN